MNILAAAADITATIADIRLCTPLAALCARPPWRLQLRSFHDCTQADLHAADVLVLQRGSSRRALDLQQRMQRSGGHVAYDIDDLLTEMPQQLLNGAAAAASRPWLLRALAGADVVTASTGRLADALRPLARRVVVVPNHAMPAATSALPRMAGVPGAPGAPGAQLTLLLAASDRVAADCLLPAIAAAAVARPGRLRLVSIGPTGLALQALGLPLQTHPFMPRCAFLALVSALPNPLALIPLDDSPFSACKSAVKWLDYAAVGVPALCSNLPPYADVATDGRHAALLPNTVAAWQQALLRALDQPAWCQALADAALAEIVPRHTLAHTVAAWQGVLQSLGPRQAVAPAGGHFSSIVERAKLALRAANRARLRRRQGR